MGPAQHRRARQDVVERLLLERVDAEARGAPVCGHHHLVAGPCAHGAEAALAPAPPAAPRATHCAHSGSRRGAGLTGGVPRGGVVDARDALVALFGWAGVAVPGLPEGCLGP